MRRRHDPCFSLGGGEASSLSPLYESMNMNPEKSFVSMRGGPDPSFSLGEGEASSLDPFYESVKFNEAKISHSYQ